MGPPYQGSCDRRPAGRALATLPGPRGVPLLGNLLQLKPTKLHTILERWADRYGPLYTFRIARKPVVVIAEPALIHEVLRQRPETYRRLRTLAAVFEDFGGEGIFVAEGARWQRQRRVIMHALSARQLRQFFPTVMAVTARLKTRFEHAARTGTAVDIPMEFRRYTAEVTTHLTFGDTMSTHACAWVELHQHLAQILPTINRRGNAPWPYWHVFSLPADRACTRALAALQAVMEACIAQGSARVAQDPTRAMRPTTVLEGLLTARDAGGTAFSDAEIMSNLLTMLVAGEDTTAHTLAWILHFLTEVPTVQHLLQREVDDVLGEAPMLPDFQAQERLGYLDAVVHETMRLKSVAPLLCFEPLQPVELGGISLPAGTGVFLLTRYVGLQDQAFPDAGQFQPTRWLLPPTVPHAERLPLLLAPFGGGPRLCPGRALAFLEIHAALAMLCRHFTVTKLGNAPPVQEHFAFTMMPKPLKLQFHARQ